MNIKRHTGSRSSGSLSLLIAVLVAATTVACVQGTPLRTEPEKAPAVKEGSYTMLLYGCSFIDRLDNAVILAPEGGQYHFELFAPSFEYKVRQGVAAAEALRDADKFLQCSRYYRSSRVRGITDPAGRTIGYEVRPLYSPIDFGRDDVLTITYRLKGDKVAVFVWLDRDIDLMVNGDSESIRHDGIDGGHSGK